MGHCLKVSSWVGIGWYLFVEVIVGTGGLGIHNKILKVNDSSKNKNLPFVKNSMNNITTPALKLSFAMVKLAIFFDIRGKYRIDWF